MEGHPVDPLVGGLWDPCWGLAYEAGPVGSPAALGACSNQVALLLAGDPVLAYPLEGPDFVVDPGIALVVLVDLEVPVVGHLVSYPYLAQAHSVEDHSTEDSPGT